MGCICMLRYVEISGSSAVHSFKALPLNLFTHTYSALQLPSLSTIRALGEVLPFAQVDTFSCNFCEINNTTLQ